VEETETAGENHLVSVNFSYFVFYVMYMLYVLGYRLKCTRRKPLTCRKSLTNVNDLEVYNNNSILKKESRKIA
jgi:hypothetical protein